MADLVATTGYTGAQVDFTEDEISIKAGDSLEIGAGIENEIFLGSKTSLTIGQDVDVHVGLAAELSLNSTVSATFGSSFEWSTNSDSISDYALRWGLLNNTFAGGISAEAYNNRSTVQKQENKAIALILTEYVSMIGASILAIELSKDNRSDSFSSINMIIDTLATISAFIFRYFIFKHLEDHHTANFVTNLTLAANGLTSFVYTDPDDKNKSPYASFLVQPGLSTKVFDTHKKPYVGYDSNNIPNLAMTSAIDGEHKTIFGIHPSGISLATFSGNSKEPLITFSVNTNTDTNNNSMVAIKNNKSGLFSIDTAQTILSRPQGIIAIKNGADNGQNSQVLVTPTTISLSTSPNGTSSSTGVSIAGSSVAINVSGQEVANFSAGKATVCGSNGVVVSSSSITIGQALVVNSGISTSSAIVPASVSLESINQSLAEANKKIAALQKEIDERKAQPINNPQPIKDVQSQIKK